MSDDIVIAGGGSTEVAPDALLDAERRLAALAGILSDLSGELAPARGLTGVPDAARLANKAAASIGSASAESRALSVKLQNAAERYGAAERGANSFLTRLAEVAGWALGGFVPLGALAAIAALPGILAAAAAVLGIGSLATGSPQAFLRDVGGLLKSKAAILRDPRMVSLVRLAVSAADDTMLGAVGVPLPLAVLADDRRSGLFGLHGATTAVVAGASLFGAFKDTPVRIQQTSVASTAAPTTYGELAGRIPPTSADGPQVRIERYDGRGGKPVFMVYVGGTVDTSAVAGSEPFDLTSDLNGVAGLDPASLRATELALHQAGVHDGDTVIPVGYSQGGIVATSIATSGQYQVPTLITFGSPTGGIDVPSPTVDVAVEHTDDLVPALGGEPREFDNGGGDRIVVSRQTFTGEVPKDSSPIDAHLMTEYTITAHRMDASTDPRLASALAALPTPCDGQVGLYRGIRD